TGPHRRPVGGGRVDGHLAGLGRGDGQAPPRHLHRLRVRARGDGDDAVVLGDLERVLQRRHRAGAAGIDRQLLGHDQLAYPPTRLPGVSTWSGMTRGSLVTTEPPGVETLNASSSVTTWDPVSVGGGVTVATVVMRRAARSNSRRRPRRRSGDSAS